MTSDLITATTIGEIVGHRDRAVQLWEAAFDAIERANDAVSAAKEEVRLACFGQPVGLGGDERIPEVAAFMKAVALPDREQYRRVARRLTDVAVWQALVERTELEVLMDATAKEQLRRQLRYVPEQHDYDGSLINQDEIDKAAPPVTVETVRATLRSFAEDAESIWRRGIATAFAQLDRRFRSHDGFRIGDRVVFRWAIADYGGLSYSSGIRDTLIDVERVFRILDGGELRAVYGSVVERIQAACRGGRVAFEVEGDYFRARGFKNGNLHLWFTRKDLLAQVNRVLAEWYGEVVADGKDRPADPDAPLRDRKSTLAKNLGFFPTPEPLARFVVDEAALAVPRTLRILEPSAGTGALVDLMAAGFPAWDAEAGGHREVRHRIDAVEIDRTRAFDLRAAGRCSAVILGDFLSVLPEETGLYDRVVMNPPFDRERDIDHVTHAWSFLRPDGILVAIMSAGTEFRQTAKSEAFRAFVERNGGRFRDNPIGSFASVGTNINTVTLVMTKRG